MNFRDFNVRPTAMMGVFVFAGLAIGLGSATGRTASAFDGAGSAGSGGSGNTGSGSGDAVVSDTAPQTLRLTGKLRDFKARSQTGGHTDFERNPSAGFGHFVGIVADQLDSDGKPVYSSAGKKVNTEARDSSGRNILKGKSYISAKSGDTNPSVATSAGDQVQDAANFAKWFRDVPGVNTSKTLDLVLTRQGTSNIYTFQDTTDPVYSTRGGFFPLDGELYGNYSNSGHNFHFTFELNTQFTYHRNAGQVFTFTGDDDVWVFVDGKLVIDIGGIHGAVSQSIDLDRCSWLADGQSYHLDFFFAERHTTQSNFRIDTTLQLLRVEPPAVGAAFD